ncbi:MAG: ABC transporter permease [Acidobacteria bacterium]|nr:MAG: ABC transporter permease [Acidobacteriota bacterium]
MSWWKFFLPKRASGAQLDSELRFHIAELVEANIAAGMPPGEARRRAMLEFGGKEQIKEEVRDVYKIRFIDSTVANLKSALRFLRKSPSFSITAILTLALGIGANSAVFSAMDAILLRPLPFPEGDQLMWLEQFHRKVKNPLGRLSPTRLEDWNRMNSTFQAITGYYTEDESETSGILPEKVTAAFVAPRFVQVWGVAPELGRDFTTEEEHWGGPSAVVISDRFWRNHFGSDPNVLREKVSFGKFSSRIVGVMPASFLFPDRDVDLWGAVPTDAPMAQSRDSTWYLTIGRLKRGVTLPQALADLEAVQAQLAKAYPKTDGDLGVRIEPLKEETVGGARKSLWMLFGSVSLLLLIACTNIVTLLLARARQREQEISLRFSLGAPRGAIVMQLLTETFVLTLAGGALGLFVAGAASKVFQALAGELPRVDEIRLDARIVLYTIACSIMVTVLCGLFPAIRETRENLSSSLARAGRGQVSGRHSLPWLLVGLQVMLAVTLLAGAGLLLRSFQALGRVSPGFDPSHVLTFHLTGSYAETANPKTLAQRIDGTIAALRRVPGVEAAAASGGLPGLAREYETELKFTDGEVNPDRKILAEDRFISDGYLATMKIPLLQGEDCRPGFGTQEGGALINRSFANTYLAGSTGIGRHLKAVMETAFIGPGEIRGIVGDAREEGLNREPTPTVYWCGSGFDPDPYYLVRTSTNPMAMAETLRKKVHEVEPARSVFEVMPLEEHLGEAFGEDRLRAILLSFFSATALSLACVGLYGTLSYTVSQRRREVGLRLALGALRGQIVKQFLLQGLGVTLLGCVAGWGLAVGFTRVLSGMLYGVSPTDAVTLSFVIFLVLFVAAIASLAPAIRAARVEPMQVLREE